MRTSKTIISIVAVTFIVGAFAGDLLASTAYTPGPRPTFTPRPPGWGAVIDAKVAGAVDTHLSAVDANDAAVVAKSGEELDLNAE